LEWDGQKAARQPGQPPERKLLRFVALRPIVLIERDLLERTEQTVNRVLGAPLRARGISWTEGRKASVPGVQVRLKEKQIAEINRVLTWLVAPKFRFGALLNVAEVKTAAQRDGSDFLPAMPP